MDKLEFTNDATAKLASPVAQGATGFTVEAGFGALFPPLAGAGTYTFLTIGVLDSGNNEVVMVTDRSGDTFTCAATQKAWPAGVDVWLPASAEILRCFRQKASPLGEIYGYSEKVETVAIQNGAITYDCAAGNVFKTILSGDPNFVISGPTGMSSSAVIGIFQDATGGRSITFPANVNVDDIEFTSTANKGDVIGILSLDGAKWKAVQIWKGVDA